MAASGSYRGDPALNFRGAPVYVTSSPTVAAIQRNGTTVTPTLSSASNMNTEWICSHCTTKMPNNSIYYCTSCGHVDDSLVGEEKIPYNLPPPISRLSISTTTSTPKTLTPISKPSWATFESTSPSRVSISQHVKSERKDDDSDNDNDNEWQCNWCTLINRSTTRCIACEEARGSGSAPTRARVRSPPPHSLSSYPSSSLSPSPSTTLIPPSTSNKRSRSPSPSRLPTFSSPKRVRQVCFPLFKAYIYDFSLTECIGGPCCND
jgi:hypothetical protein